MRSTRVFSTLGILCVVLSLKCNADKTELIIGSLERSEDKDRGVQLGITHAIHVAKNSSSLKDFLEKYEIRIVSYHTRGNVISSIASATHALRYRKGGFPLLLLGPQTSSEASWVLMIARYYRKLTVTYLTTTGDGIERRDPYGFTFAPAPFPYLKAVLKMMNHFKWKRFAIVYDLLETGGFYVKNVESLMMNTDLTIIGHEAIDIVGINQGTQDKLRKLKDLDSKIFFGAFSSRGASLVFCEVFKMGLFGPGFVWILHPNAGNIDLWVYYATIERLLMNRSGLCTREQYQRVAERIFILDKNITYRSNENTTTASGLTLRQIFNTPDVGALSKSQKIEMTIAFDTMWGVMLALKESSKELPNSMPLEQNVKRFLGNARITKTIELKLRNVSFEGLTGPVSFTKNEERSGIVIIRQYQADRTALVPIGGYHIIQDKFVVYDEVKDSLWKDNHQPMDHSQRELEFMKIQVPLIAAMWGFAAIGIACSSGFLRFNIRNRKKSVIKMSSPNLNSIIVMGCMLCYAAVILFGLDARFLYLEEYTFICNARSAVLCIGYSLSFGAMFSKTWRVHKIFTAGLSRDKMAIKDSHLLVTIAALLMIDVVFLSSWILTDPLQAKILAFEERASQENHIVTIPALYQCTCRYKTYFLAVLFTYKGLLLFFGIFLAWETRNVSIPALNDSKYIGMSVYNVFVLSIIGASVSLAFEGSVHHEAPYAILSICLIMSTSVTLLLVFVPKIYQFHAKVKEATQNIRVSELMEGQILQSICRATQTDLGVSELKAEADEAFSSSDEIPQEASDEKNGCGIQPVKLISERSTGQKDKAAKTPGPVTS